MNLTIVWRFLFGAREVMSILVSKEKRCSDCAKKNISRHRQGLVARTTRTPGLVSPWHS
jgi:hypothetical protein